MKSIIFGLLATACALLAAPVAEAQNVGTDITGQSNVNTPCFGSMGQKCTPADPAHGLPVGATIISAATFTTPAGTTAYTSGDLVANSATAGSVAPLSFTVCRAAGATGMVRRVRIKTADSGFSGQPVRLHLYHDLPTASNGDNGVWLTTDANYIGSMDVTIDKTFSDPYYKGIGAPTTGAELNFDCAAGSQVIYGLLEARATITPQGAKAWTVTLEVLAN